MKLTQQQILIGVFAVMVIVGLGIIQMPASIVGGSALSIDKVETNEGNKIIYTVAMDGSSGSGTITFTPEQALQYGFSITEPITFEVEESCRYLIDDTPKIIYSLEHVNGGVSHDWDTGGCSDKNAQSRVTQLTTLGCVNISTYKYIHPQASCYPTSNTYAKYPSTVVYTNGWKSQGVAYTLESTTFFDTQVNVKIGSGDAKTLTLNNLNKEASVPGVTVKLIGSLMGTQSCPVAQSEIVAYQQNGQNTLALKDRFSYNQLISMHSSLLTAQARNASNYPYVYQQFVGSTPQVSSYCEFEGTNLQETSLRCTPYSAVAIPVLQIIIDGEAVGMTIPEGAPEITEVKAQPTEAGVGSKVSVQFRNTGGADSFDVALNCPTQVSSASQRYSLTSGESKTVELLYQGSGIIEDCEVKVNSVNHPETFDVENVRILIYPTCSKPAPSQNHIRVWTEFGCYWVCPNGYSADVTNDCNAISPDEYSDLATSTYGKSNYHCLNSEGQYTTLAKYAEMVNESEITPFIPDNREHQYFIAGQTCRYTAEYGYIISGNTATAITGDYVFSYSALPSQGSEYVEGESGTLTPNDTDSFDLSKLSLTTLLVVIVIGAVVFMNMKRR